MVTNNSKNQPTGTSGKVMQGQGIGSASSLSTATYPSTATGTGKILRADGTNWVASTATYPDTAGTSGNVLVSDGTNWSSSTSSGGSLNKGFVTTLGGNNPLDSPNKYFFAPSLAWDTTGANPRTNFYVTQAFTMNKIYAIFSIAGTVGSSQTFPFYCLVNLTTQHDFDSAFTLNAATKTFSTTSFGLSLSAGDFFCFGITAPTWTTNPTNISFSIAWSE